jgi:hypothetical protein
MSTSNFNLRGISPETMTILKREAKDLKISANTLILRLIDQGLGFGSKRKRIIHHDLDFLFGTWTEEEGKEFEDNIKVFERIDEEIWS